MSAPPLPLAPPGGAPSASGATADRSGALRWGLPAALLAAEYLALSILVDLPLDGPYMPVVRTLRLAVPVALGAAVGGVLLARGSRSAEPGPAAPLPAWRPGPALAVQVAAFAAAAALTRRILAEGAPPLTGGALAAWLAILVAVVLLAVRTAAPLAWVARRVVTRWRTPLLALAAGLLAWRGALEAERLWGVLSEGTLRGAAALLRLGAAPVTVELEERLIGVGGFDVEISEVCSGVDGLGLVLVFQAVWIATSRDRVRLPRALVLLPLGAAAALAANVLRIAALVLLGASGREALALGGFHSRAGWVLFTAVALGSVALAERAAWLRRAPAPRPDATAAAASVAAPGVPAAAAAYVAPLLGAIATALVTGAWSEGALDRAYGARILVAGIALLLVRRSLSPPVLSWSWPPVLLAGAVAVPWIAFGAGDGAGLADAVARLGPAERAAWIATRVAGSCLVVPLAEELAFRGFLLPWLVSPDFERVPPRAWTWTAVALSSLGFGLLHGGWILGTAAGVAFAIARLVRGRLGDAVLAHALCNAAIAAAVMLSGRWGLWS
ncbi:exosortase E/protease, VPEID-CTERM system [Anaeromyxobacter oryzae]|uniref:CAAX prenyl protease 2/Lysostaphin resistance protein A-like domain-containing protein n=1 Tax=Anaeromyxobacter oryzae TaxID=2918170 RepID=A0ABM7WYV7_9BACT|nr:exosortase E/protease, VPEID-CTERM system [Anaeromyxobacter oryzae]BDG04619.1 hypothetical protein AMOR_36150 [Anaeromyxobacter oryzae]